MEERLEENIEGATDRNGCERQRLENRSMGKLKEIPPNISHQGLERWWMFRALPGAMSRVGADITLLLSRSPYPATFSCGAGASVTKTEEAGEGYCHVMEPCVGIGRCKVQPEPQQKLLEEQRGCTRVSLTTERFRS